MLAKGTSMARKADSSDASNGTQKFPLWLHPTGQWCKKVKGEFHYFGKDQEVAYERWMERKDDILAGRKFRVDDQHASAEVTVKYIVNFMLTAKKRLVESNEITQRHFNDLVRSGEMIVNEFGRSRTVSNLRPDDFRDLRTKMAKRWSSSSLVREIGNVRQFFNYAYDNQLLQRPVPFGTVFSMPSLKSRRIARLDAERKWFEPSDLQRIIEAASVPLRAMILLGLNTGIGNHDVAMLERKHVDLAGGWLNQQRRKTGVPRRAKLWSETINAISTYQELRVKSDAKRLPAKKWRSLMFLTKYRNPWSAPDRTACSLSTATAKLLKRLELHRPGLSFYTFRHIYRTIADEVKDPPAVNYTMGHDDGSTANVYRERIVDSRLEDVASHVHKWLFCGESK